MCVCVCVCVRERERESGLFNKLLAGASSPWEGSIPATPLNSWPLNILFKLLVSLLASSQFLKCSASCPLVETLSIIVSPDEVSLPL